MKLFCPTLSPECRWGQETEPLSSFYMSVCSSVFIIFVGICILVFAVFLCVIVPRCIVAGWSRNLSEWPVSAKFNFTFCICSLGPYWNLYFVFVFAACICIIISQCIVAGGGRGRNLSEWPVSATNQEEETHSLTSSVNTLSNTQHTTVQCYRLQSRKTKKQRHTR